MLRAVPADRQQFPLRQRACRRRQILLKTAMPFDLPSAGIDTPDKLLYHPYLNISTVTDTVNAPVEIDLIGIFL